MTERSTATRLRAGVDRVRVGRLDRTDGLLLLWFLALALAVLFPLLRPGSVLSLDGVGSPHLAYVTYLLRAKDPLYYGRLPVAALLDGLGVVLPNWVVQRLLLGAIVVGSSWSAARACRRCTAGGRLVAGTLYAVNPFVYVRLLAGHWWLLLGYAVLPLAVVAVDDALAARGTGRRAAGWTTLAVAFDPHVAVLAAVVFASVGGARLWRSGSRRRVAGRLGRVGGLTLLLNGYWLLPAIGTLGAGTSKVSAIGGLDLVAFSARGTLAGNVPLSVAMLFGFWRRGARLPTSLVPLPAVLVGFGLVLFLALTGLSRDRRRPLSVGLAVAGLVGFVLALGVSVPATAPLFRFLVRHVPLFGGMRDSQKFVSLLALADALLGGVGADALLDGWRRWWTDRGSGARPASPRRPSWRRSEPALSALLVAGLLVGPLLLTWPMLGGLSGQLTTTHYPDGWAAANQHLVDDPGQYRVLFLPWHQYLAFPWTHGVVATPADAYFQRPVVRSHDIDLAGIGSQATSPTNARVVAILAAPGPRAGDDLAALGIKYVAVARTADYRQYDALVANPDLVPVVSTPALVLYRNRAFDRAPPPADWPRAWPVVPRTALLAGAAVTWLAALGATLGSPVGRPWLTSAVESWPVERSG